MNTQPEALRLADCLVNIWLTNDLNERAAAELRRLHEENKALRDRLAQPQDASKQFHEWAVTEHEKIKAQPQGEWVGLTDEEIDEVAGNVGYGYIDVAKAIEAKLKEKNFKGEANE